MDRVRISVLSVLAVAAAVVGYLALSGIIGSHPGDADRSGRRGPVGVSPAASAPAGGPGRARLDEAWEMIRVANWAAARRILEDLDRTATDRDVRAQAVFALGHVWQHSGSESDRDRAGQCYRRVVRDFGRSPSAAWSKLALARMAATPEVEPKDAQAARALRTEARRRYREIVEDHPGHMVADEATVWLATTYLEQVSDADACRQGAEILTQYLARRPDNYLVAVMHHMLAEHYQRGGEFRKAIEHLAAADEGGLPSEADRASAYFRIARIAERELNDYALAAKWYGRIATDARRDDRYHVARLSAARCAMLAERQRRGEEGRP